MDLTERWSTGEAMLSDVRYVATPTTHTAQIHRQHMSELDGTRFTEHVSVILTSEIVKLLISFCVNLNILVTISHTILVAAACYVC